MSEQQPPSDDAPNKTTRVGGALAWMARNPVAANLFMLVLMVGGLAMTFQLKQEVFPEIELDVVSVQVTYPGASPSEVEQGIVLAVEEAVRGIDGVKKVTATARESLGLVNVELLLGADRDRALSDVKSAVDRIVSFPEEAERPVVQLIANRREVISLVVYGDVREEALRVWAERAREDLLNDPNITQIDLLGARPLEVSVEVSQEKLREYNLTHDQLAALVRQSSLELPGGGLKTDSGEVLVRTAERKDRGEEFEEIVVLSRPDGTQVRLGDLATVRDGFRETEEFANYEGKRAIMLRVFRVADQNPIEVADAVKKYAEDNAEALPEGLSYALWNDQSQIYRERIDLLLRNAYMGLALVFVCLGLFLDFKLAFWVMLGIPISFLGSMLLLPVTDVSINMISLFAFIITLGIVVDDAIVVGENIHSARQRGLSFEDAAVMGVRQIAAPVVFSVTTTVVAFAPMFFVPGTMGKIFKVIPTIVIAVLLLSLFESLLILPAHLAHGNDREPTGVFGAITRGQRWFSEGMERFIREVYGPSIDFAVRFRYLSIAVGVATLVGVFGIVAGGRIDFTFFPKIDGDVVNVSARLPIGAPLENAEALRARLERSAREAIEQSGGDAVYRGLYAQIGQPFAVGGPGGGGVQATGSHIVDMAIYLVPSDERDFTASAFSERWRATFGDVPGLDSLSFRYSIGPSAGEPINIQLSHPNTDILEGSAQELAAALVNYPGVKDIEDGVLEGKPQLDFQLTERGRALGLTPTDLARQIRAAYFGSEAVRQQRGRDEVRIMVRLPKEDRASIYSLEELLLRTPNGGEITLSQAAQMTEGRAYTEITRVDGRRVVNVTADVGDDGPTPNEIIRAVGREVMPDLLERHPGLFYSLEGEQREQSETMGSLLNGLIMALLVIFALLAIPFKSYTQPIIIMSAIPFGAVGAILGHLLMGYSISLMSMMGLVALSGIVVNDSLVLIVTINELREEGRDLLSAISEGAQSRFRPIILTSLTTFFGLVPMIAETSVQARFLIPMAISLGFGVIFATFIILILVPSSYMVLEDAHAGVRWVRHRLFGDDDHDPHGDDHGDTPGVQTTRLD